MIKSLRIRNLATIEDLELELTDGFSILTGETGAGKSIIIDALRLILGEKSSSDFIRTGKTEASIEALIEGAATALLPTDSDPQDDQEILIQRQISGQGSGKAYLNGILVPLKRLKEAGSSIADIYGQNDHVFLLGLENHLLYLDAFVAAERLRREVAETAAELRSLLAQKRDLEFRQTERLQKLDFLSYQIREIENAELKAGEEEALTQDRQIMKNAEKISSLISQALDLSYSQEESILSRLSRLQSVLKELLPFSPSLEASFQAIAEMAISLRELADSLIRLKDGSAASAEDLEAVEERLAVIDRLKRKYGPGIPDILSYGEKIKRDLEDLSANQEKLESLEKNIQDVFELYAIKAGELSKMRAKKAIELEKLIAKEIAQLGMKKAAFKIKIGTVLPSLADLSSLRETGSDEVEFLISPNPGEELKPLRKIASGGEISRIMLALKSLGKETEPPRTLIFDEIDSGIGGRTAEFIAEKLNQLARKHQVICITHLPQIAASASHHFRVDKTFEKERTFTSVKKLGAEERAEEISRLISGTRMTEASLSIAKEMLAGKTDLENAGRRGKRS